VSAAAQRENGKPLVLVADDDPDILALITFRLERGGHDVVAANDGEEALRLALSLAQRGPSSTSPGAVTGGAR
jgi:CheY-like chemotaxis protein